MTKAGCCAHARRIFVNTQPTAPMDQLTTWLPDAWKKKQLAKTKSVLLTGQK